MAHNNDATPPAYHNPYPAWPAVPPPQPYPPQQSMNGQPPQLPQPSALPALALPPELQNLNLTPHQLAALFSHFQAQAPQVTLPPPPPPPNFAYSTATAASSASHPASLPLPLSQPTTQNTHAGGQLPAHLTYSSAPLHDLEEGELSDAASTPYPASSAQSKKRKLPATKREERLVSQRSSAYNGLDTNRNGHGHPRPRTADTNPSVTHSADFSAKKAGALKFLATLHEEGYTFDQLIQEGLDAALLRHVFEELHLSTAPSTSTVPSTLAQNASVIATTQSLSKTTTPSALAQNPPVPATRQPLVPAHQPAESTTKKSDTVKDLPESKTKKPEPVRVPAIKPAAPAPVDRQAYLARLQAVKNKKSAAPSAKSTTPAQTTTQTPTQPPTIAKPPVLGVTTRTAEAWSQPSTQREAQQQPSTKQDAEQKAIPGQPGPLKAQPASKSSDAATELVRKKMEALKSMKRRLAVPPPSPSPIAPQIAITPSKPDDPATIFKQATASNTTTAPTNTQSFGIPGLFMSGTVPATSATTTASNTPPGPSAFHVPANPATQESLDRLISETSFVASASTPEPTPKTRRRPVAADLNEASTPPDVPVYKRPFGRSRRNSSDESMIIEVSDDEGASPSAPLDTTSFRQKSIRDLPPLKDFPQRNSNNKTGMLQGGASTPLGTPGAAAEAEQLQRKEVELNALKARIQELERRKKAAKAKAQIERNLVQDVATPRTTSPSASEAVLPSLPGLGLVTAQPSNDHVTLEADIIASDAALKTSRTQVVELRRQMVDLEQQSAADELKNDDLDAQAVVSDVDASEKTVDQHAGDAEVTSEQDSPSEEGQITDGSLEMYDSESPDKLPEAPQITNDSPDVIPEPSSGELDQLLAQGEQESSDDDMGSSMSESSESDNDLTQPVQTTVAEAQDSSMDTDSSGADMSASETSSDEADDEPAAPNANAGDESEDVEMDLDGSDSDDSDDYEPTHAQLHASSESDVKTREANAADVSMTDSVVPERPADHTELDIQAPQQRNEASVTVPHYKPYESPLKMFKKYRFHPNYLQEVSGGFRSLTYSHLIKHDVPLCRFEFAGGICHDQSCDGQHWRDMVMKDEELLINLGTGHSSPAFRDGKGPKEDRDRWMAGMTAVIHKVSREHPGSSEAAKLERSNALYVLMAQYRREWLIDPTIIVSE